MVEGILAFNWPGLVLSVPTWLPGGIQFDKLSWISLQVISFQVQPEGCVQIHMLFGKGSLVWCAKGLPKTTTHALFWGSRDCLNLFLFATKRQSWKHFLAPSCMLLGSTIIKVVRPSTVLSQVIVPYTVYPFFLYSEVELHYEVFLFGGRYPCSTLQPLDFLTYQMCGFRTGTSGSSIKYVNVKTAVVCMRYKNPKPSLISLA